MLPLSEVLIQFLAGILFHGSFFIPAKPAKSSNQGFNKLVGFRFEYMT